MNQRPKLEFQLNQPVEIELLYNEAIVGRNDFGEYYLYAVKVDGEEYSLFAHPDVHNALKNLKKGQRARITRLPYQNGKHVSIKWDVQVIETENAIQPQDIVATVTDTNGDTKDHLYKILLQSYKDAIELQKELNGMIDIEKAAITLFIARSKLNGNGFKSEVL